MRAIFRPHAGASKRTKNRLTEHREFEILSGRHPTQLFGGEDALLLACTCHEEAWMGWLPFNELEEVR